jgi:hypothetical protein
MSLADPPIKIRLSVKILRGLKPRSLGPEASEDSIVRQGFEILRGREAQNLGATWLGLDLVAETATPAVRLRWSGNHSAQPSLRHADESPRWNGQGAIQRHDAAHLPRPLAGACDDV